MNKNDCLLLPRCQNRGRREKNSKSYSFSYTYLKFFSPSRIWGMGLPHHTAPHSTVRQNLRKLTHTTHSIQPGLTHLYLVTTFPFFQFFLIFVLSKHDRLSLDKIVLFSNNLNIGVILILHKIHIFIRVKN